MAWDKKKMNWAYIAGFVDGEGHIEHKLEGNSNRFRITIAQLAENAEVLYAISQFLGERGIENVIKIDNSRTGSDRNPKPMAYLAIGKAKHIYRFLLAIQPYAYVKSDSIYFIIGAIEERRKWAKENKKAYGAHAYLGWGDRT